MSLLTVALVLGGLLPAVLVVVLVVWLVILVARR